MAKRFHKSRLQSELWDVIKRIRQLYGALRLRVSIQIAQLITHIEDDVISRVDNLLALPRFIFGSRLSLGLRSLGSLFTINRHSASDTPAFILQREQLPGLIQNARFDHQSLIHFSQGLR